jgi:hypothetical protein
MQNTLQTSGHTKPRGNCEMNRLGESFWCDSFGFETPCAAQAWNRIRSYDFGEREEDAPPRLPSFWLTSHRTLARASSRGRVSAGASKAKGDALHYEYA